MKRRTKIILFSPLAVIVLGFILILTTGIWKKPYKEKLDSIVLPPESETVAENIAFSDVYGKHVCVDKVIACNMNIAELENYIIYNNPDGLGEKVFIMKVDTKEKRLHWDDYCINFNSIDYEPDRLYYYISISTPYGRLWYD